MYLDDQTKKILSKKLNFSTVNLTQLDSNLELSAKALGFMQILKSVSKPQAVMPQILQNLKGIKKDLEKYQNGEEEEVIHRAYRDFYSF